jgi:hypothetical protein
MRFKQYLNEDRSKSIDNDVAFDWIEKNAKKALAQAKKGNFIYRGISNHNDALMVDPTSGKRRRSANVGSNYYTLLIDNLPAWKQYPERSRSLICTTSIQKAEDYGSQRYIVFPKDSSKIGVCSDDDIFTSFPYMFKKFKISSLFDFSRFMVELSRDLGLNKSDKDWGNMLKLFKKRDDTDLPATSKWYRLLVGGDSVKEIDEIMDPKKNKFQLKKPGDTMPHSREVWTDGVSVLLTFDAYEEMTGESGDDTVDFESNYPIDKLLIMENDLYRSYVNYNASGYRPSNSVPVWMEYMGDGKFRYMAINNLTSIIKAIMKGKTTIDLSIEGSGQNPYSTTGDKFKYRKNLEFKGMEYFASDEALQDDKEDWGH